MKRVSQLFISTLLAGVAFLQLSCGDATADSKEKISPGDGSKPEAKTSAPAQPRKPVIKSEEEWKKILTPEQFHILREHGTERAWGKAYDEWKKQGAGTYYCAGCDAELFTSKEKFDARCGWPAFFDASKHENIKTLRDTSFGTVRVEVRCKVCDHVTNICRVKRGSLSRHPAWEIGVTNYCNAIVSHDFFIGHGQLTVTALFRRQINDH